MALTVNLQVCIFNPSARHVPLADTAQAQDKQHQVASAQQDLGAGTAQTW